MPQEGSGKFISLLPISIWQLGQDLNVLAKSNFKFDGYFVEIGARDE